MCAVIGGLVSNSLEIQINFAEQSHIYTTEDSISGTVSIAMDYDVHFDDIEISLALTASLVIPIQISNQHNNKECKYPVPDGGGDIPPPAYSDC